MRQSSAMPWPPGKGRGGLQELVGKDPFVAKYLTAERDSILFQSEVLSAPSRQDFPAGVWIEGA